MRDGKKDGRLVVPGRLTWGVLLTRGCDIDNGKERQVAYLRPLRDFSGDETQAAIIDGRHLSVHYLPAAELGGTRLFDDMVVDFRFITTLHRDCFNQLDRPVSLTRDGLLDLYFGWMRHTIGKPIPMTAPCPKCGADVDVFHVAEAAATPPDDY